MELNSLNKKNIVIFNKNVPAGVSTILKNIIQFSNHNDLSYKLVLYKFDEDNHAIIDDEWCKDVVRLELSNRNNLFYTIKTLKEEIDQNSIIIANDVPELRMCALFRLKNPLVYIIHGDFETYYKHCEIFQDYMDTIIGYSRHIIFKLRKRLRKENTHKIRLIYYPVPILSPTSKDQLVLKLIFVGSLIRRKGVDLLPEIIAQIEKANIRYQFTIAGSGELDSLLQENLSSNKNVFLIGQKSNEEIIELFQENDALLFPTRSEGLPNVLVESMKAGCIPIVSDIESGIPDVVTHKENGYLIKPDDIVGFVDAVLLLHGNLGLRHKLKINAIKAANRMFDPYDNANAYYEAFVSTPFKSKIPLINVPTGPLLNQPFLPNYLVKAIRSLKINPNL